MNVRAVDDPPEHEPEIDPEEAKTAVERWVLPYIEDSALWPVLLVVIAHIAAFVAPMLLWLARDRSIAAMIGTGWLGWLTFVAIRYEVRLRGRVGSLTWVILLTWGLSFLAAYYGDKWQII